MEKKTISVNKVYPPTVGNVTHGFPQRPGIKACSFYVKTGTCKFGSQCRYDHPPNRIDSITLRPAQLPSKNAISNLIHNLQHQDATRQNQHDIRAMICNIVNYPDRAALARAFAQGTWFESFITKASSEIIMSHAAGDNRELLSFQRIVIPLLRVLVEPGFVRCGLRSVIDVVFSKIHPKALTKDNDPPFELHILNCLEALLKLGHVHDPRWFSNDVREHHPELLLPSPKTWTDVLPYIVQFFRIVGGRFIMDLGHPFYGDVITVLDKALQHHDMSPEIKAEFNDLVVLRESNLWQEVEGQFQRPKRVLPVVQKLHPPASGGPGELSITGVPRHDNDFIDFRCICLAPNTYELSDTAVTFLPRNLPCDNAYHFLVHDYDRVFEIQPDLQHEFEHRSDHVMLDTHARLLREDFLSQIRETRRKNKAGASRYPFVKVNTVKIITNLSRGIMFRISFASPVGVTAKAWPARLEREFLKPGSLVFLKNDDGTFIGLHVMNRVTTTAEIRSERHRNGAIVPFIDVIPFDDEKRHIVLPRLLSLAFATFNESRGPLIEHVFGQAFAIRPIFEALKTKTELPFNGRFSQRLLLSDTTTHTPHRPVYVSEHTLFDLRGIAAHGAPTEQLARCDLVAQEKRPDNITLDETQFAAFRNALMNEMAVIQGPPGTGKSYCTVAIVHCLLQTFRRWIGSPILLICYTNHALDQLVEAIMDKTQCESSIVR